MLSSRMRRNFACSATLISAISSRKMVPSWASSKHPWRRSSAPVNAPLLVAEDLALEQRLRNRRAVDGDEGPPAPRRQLVERARDELLARAALARDEHGGGRGRRQLDQPVHRLHGRTRSHEPPQSPELLHAPAQEGDLAERLRLLRRLRDEQLDPRHLDRLGEEVVRAFLHRRHRRVDRPLPGEQDDRGEGHLLGERPQELEPVHPGHDEVADHHRGLGHARLVERLGAVGRLLDGVAPAGQQRGEPAAGGRVVVGDQHLARHRHPSPAPGIVCRLAHSSRARPLSAQGASPGAPGTSARARSRRPGWSRRARDPSRPARRARRPARTSGRDTPAPWSAARRSP